MLKDLLPAPDPVFLGKLGDFLVVIAHFASVSGNLLHQNEVRRFKPEVIGAYDAVFLLGVEELLGGGNIRIYVVAVDKEEVARWRRPPTDRPVKTADGLMKITLLQSRGQQALILTEP